MVYTPRQIAKGIQWTIDSPNLLFREMNRVYHSTVSGKDYYRDGFDVFEEEWDTLVILDACRYDMFSDQNYIDGQLSKRVSRASHTVQFLKGNFDGRELYDTVYSTASPQFERRDDVEASLHRVNNVWNTEYWDEDEGTVPPDSMTDAAIEAHESYPNKRHVVHYMQPHYPFIGSDIDQGTRGFHEEERENFDFWNARMRGRVTLDSSDIWTAYRANLDIALNAVERLIDAIDGRVVISSDHGNMIGERSQPLPIKEWGHPWRVYTSELVEVPWLVVDTDASRRVEESPPADERTKVDRAVTEDRLKDLGYV